MPWQAWVLIVWFVTNCLMKIYYGAEGKSVKHETADAVGAPITYGILIYCVLAVT